MTPETVTFGLGMIAGSIGWLLIHLRRPEPPEPVRPIVVTEPDWINADDLPEWEREFLERQAREQDFAEHAAHALRLAEYRAPVVPIQNGRRS